VLSGRVSAVQPIGIESCCNSVTSLATSFRPVDPVAGWRVSARATTAARTAFWVQSCSAIRNVSMLSETTSARASAQRTFWTRRRYQPETRSIESSNQRSASRVKRVRSPSARS